MKKLAPSQSGKDGDNNPLVNKSNRGGPLAKFKAKNDSNKLQSSLTTKSDGDLRDLKLDLSILDNNFDKWFKEEESLSGVLNMKVIK